MSQRVVKMCTDVASLSQVLDFPSLNLDHIAFATGLATPYPIDYAAVCVDDKKQVILTTLRSMSAVYKGNIFPAHLLRSHSDLSYSQLIPHRLP